MHRHQRPGSCFRTFTPGPFSPTDCGLTLPRLNLLRCTADRGPAKRSEGRKPPGRRQRGTPSVSSLRDAQERNRGCLLGPRRKGL
ncbi:hypothetical protein GN956_G1614 [Arapaima gigas]